MKIEGDKGHLQYLDNIYNVIALLELMFVKKQENFHFLMQKSLEKVW